MTAEPSRAPSSYVDVNGVRGPYPALGTTLDLIEHQAAVTPDARALVYDERHASYADLDGKANALAHRLLEIGAPRDRLLPLLVSDGLELPVAMVAAMKAGIAFVPFDPAWPRERIEGLLHDLGTDLLVCSPRTPEAQAAIGRAVTVDYTELVATTEHPATARPTRNDLMYGFFTSGTTGRPKCALNVHQGLLNRFLSMTRRFGAGHVSLQNSRSVFDSSLWQLLWPLTMGGSVVMPVRDGLLDLERTVRQIGRNGVTITDFVPSIFTVFVDLLAADPELAETASCLQHVLVGGEAINVDAVGRFLQVLPGVAVTNTYGPTEASIGSVFHTVFEVSGDEIPLGRPIDNTAAVVVDDEMRRLGPGETGEILIGGDCVGAGYLGDEARTAKAFVSNPFPDVRGERLYRTGDLGQYRDDGLLYFVGRADDQIKLRGVRIEPAEVERELVGLAGVEDAHVLVHGQSEHAILVAAVVTNGSFDPLAAVGHARALLPGEHVPDRFVVVEHMPLTANGKCDRRALARMVEEALAGADGSASPADETAELTDVQRAVRDVWNDVLGGVSAGPDDSFFDVGGTSLSAQRLALRLREVFGAALSVRDVVEAPTIAEQARLVEGGGRSAGRPGIADTLLADAQLPQWQETRSPTAGPPGHVLLTGATGFIGVHLLEALLARTGAAVSCLVNAGDLQAARQRLADRIRHYERPVDVDDPRVRIVVGNLGAERFGLDADAFADLATQVDTIVHAGAEVNLLSPYARLRAVNVHGTREVVRLARSGRPKSIHHLSTLGVLPEQECALTEDTCLRVDGIPADAYSQTKWVSEVMLGQAEREGVPVSIYRMGEVMPHSDTGVFSHAGSAAEMVIRSCVELGCTVDTGAVADFTPVDQVSDFVAAAVAAGVPVGSVHVVARAVTALDDILARFAETFALRTVPYDVFRDKLEHVVADGDGGGFLAKTRALLPDEPAAEGPLAGLFFAVPTAEFSERCARLRGELAVHWPDPSPAVWDRWAHRLRIAVPHARPAFVSVQEAVTRT